MTDSDRQSISGDVVSAPDVTGDWLSPAAAALRLGISERTLWREVKAGKYHRKIEDRKALILVPDSGARGRQATETGLAVAPDSSANAPALAELANRLTRQANTVTRQAVQITRLNADKQKLTAERDALAERLAGVERERDQLREAAERPWWQFWRDA
jgi:hypothetical protein